MAATQAETGRPVPSVIDQLPTVLRDECRDLGHVYRLPGALLLAYRGGQPIGCVGLVPHSPGTAEIKRLNVRPAHRGGVGRVLIDHVHRHAVHHQLTRLVLSVVPTRTGVIDFCRRLGYIDTQPYDTAPIAMIFLERTGRWS